MRDFLEETYDRLLFMDGFDAAILGVSDNFREPVVVYSRKKCIDILCQEMDYIDAVEYFEFN